MMRERVMNGLYFVFILAGFLLLVGTAALPMVIMKAMGLPLWFRALVCIIWTAFFIGALAYKDDEDKG